MFLYSGTCEGKEFIGAQIETAADEDETMAVVVGLDFAAGRYAVGHREVTENGAIVRALASGVSLDRAVSQLENTLGKEKIGAHFDLSLETMIGYVGVRYAQIEFGHVGHMALGSLNSFI